MQRKTIWFGATLALTLTLAHTSYAGLPLGKAAKGKGGTAQSHARRWKITESRVKNHYNQASRAASSCRSENDFKTFETNHYAGWGLVRDYGNSQGGAGKNTSQYKTWKSKFDSLESQGYKGCEGVIWQIAQKNASKPLPKEVYSGGDKASWRSLIQQTAKGWKTPLLKVVFSKSSWETTKRKQYYANGQPYYVNSSSLAVQTITKFNNKVARVAWGHCLKDNKSGKKDVMLGGNSYFIPLSKVK